MIDRWKDRKLKDSFKNAARIKEEYPQYIQPDASDKDMVLMFEEIQALTAKVEALEKELRKTQLLLGHERGDAYLTKGNKHELFKR